MGRRHTLYAIVLDGTTPLKLGALASGAHNAEIATVEPESGAPYNEASFLQAITETVEAESLALGTVLGAVSPTGVTCVESGKTYTAVQMFGRALNECDVDGTLAGSNHKRIACAKARLYIDAIGVTANQLATISLRGLLLSADGDAEAVTEVSNVALPTGLVVNEAFRLHAVRLGGVTLDADKISSVRLSPQVALTPAFGVKARPSAAVLTKVTATVEVESQDTLLTANFPRGGVAMTHLNTVLEFRKLDPTTGGDLATTEEEHVRLTLSGRVRPSSTFRASGSAPATSGLRGVLTGAAGAPPIVVETGVALTL